MNTPIIGISGGQYDDYAVRGYIQGRTQDEIEELLDLYRKDRGERFTPTEFYNWLVTTMG